MSFYLPTHTTIQWVLKDLSEDGLPPLHRIMLTQPPDRQTFFEKLLPELDYEIKGGTWEHPRWAFEEHPWFLALGLSKEECENYLRST